MTITSFDVNLPQPKTTDVYLIGSNFVAFGMEIIGLLYMFNYLPLGRRKRNTHLLQYDKKKIMDIQHLIQFLYTVNIL